MKRGMLKLLRAVVIGVIAFVLLSLLPRLLLTLNGVNLEPTPTVTEEEPIYHDKTGKRINQPDHDLLMGHDQAEAQGITSHAACKATFKGFMAMGCHRHVTEQKHIPPYVHQGNWIGGKTTAQCRAEVDAYWRAATQDQREQGDDHAADVWTRRNWGPDLQECQNYDNVRIGKVIYEPTERLDKLLLQLAEGGHATEQDKAMVRQDMLLVSTFPDHEAKRAYLDKADRFFQRADGP
jgi:hypothetical protein